MIPPIVIDTIGGFCPVQAEGTIDGLPFYFRSRGEHAELTISRVGTEPVLPPPEDLVFYVRARIADWPDAGYLELEEAEAMIERAALLYAWSQPAPEEPWSLGGLLDRAAKRVAR